MANGDSRWWFVARVGDSCEVQLHDEFGRSKASVSFAPGNDRVGIPDGFVPSPILRLAEGCVSGGGQYANSLGQLLDWMGNPIS
jgi:hypothetical protein